MNHQSIRQVPLEELGQLALAALRIGAHCTAQRCIQEQVDRVWRGERGVPPLPSLLPTEREPACQK